MKIVRLRTNRLDKPLGFQMDTARISYVVEETRGKRQIAARVFVALDPDFETIIYDSQERDDIDSICYSLPIELMPRTRYYWKVKVWADSGEIAESSVTWFETAKALDEDWNGYFITQTFAQNIHPVFFRDIEVKKEIKKVRAYGVGLGVYELYLNGDKVGDEYLLPGIHAYDSWLQYQTFELEFIQGINRVEAKLGDGWYKGAYGIGKRSKPKSDRDNVFIMEIHIEYTDGTNEIIGTNLDWKVRKGKVLFDSIYNGEVYDGTVDDTEGFSVKLSDVDIKLLQPRLSPKITIHERLKVVEVIHTPAGETVLDLGQNMVGWLEFKADFPKGTKIKLQYGEILQEGNFYRDNLRTAQCEFTYISSGESEVVRPHFTFYGFRYVKVEGWIGELNADDFIGCVIHSNLEETGRITTSNDEVNRLIENIRWSQKGNFLDIPTDCPQRDERMGWTGDAQIFCDTACYNMDTYGFYEKYSRDLFYEQMKYNGRVPYVVPMAGYELGGATTWGDAATIIPWQTYLHFGDKTILKNQYESMVAWVEYMRREDESTGNTRLWTTGKHFGDWLALDGKVRGGVYGSTENSYIATAFYYYSTDILAKTAKVLGNDKDEAVYSKLAKEIKLAFIKEYYTESGRLSMDTQTAYAIAVFMDLVPDRARERIKNDFMLKLRDNGYLLNTGFVGTAYLCMALSESGWNDIAYRLLLNKQYPSWLYEVEMGATTIWERWNSVLPDGKISSTGMNSLNHYAYGSIASWMYRYMVGIRPVEEVPGFRKVVIAPLPNRRLSKVKAVLASPCGTYEVAWEYDRDQLNIKVEIPFGAEANVILPYSKDCNIQSNKAELMVNSGNNNVSYNLAAGNYEFSYIPRQEEEEIYSLDSNLNELLNYNKTREVVNQYFPKVFEGIPFQNEASTLREVVNSPFAEIDQEDILRLDKELREIK